MNVVNQKPINLEFQQFFTLPKTKNEKLGKTGKQIFARETMAGKREKNRGNPLGEDLN